MTKGDSRPAAQNDGERGSSKGVKSDEVASTVTGDSLIIFYKKFHFPNDLMVKVPKRSDRVCLPPPGYLTISESSLRAGLRFPPPLELINISTMCGVSLSQFSHRAMSVMMGLIAFFRDRGAVLTPEYLLRMGRFILDTQGRVTFRSKWLDMRTRDPLKIWAHAFFYVKNDWGLIEKWGRMKDLPVPLHVGEEDILRVLNIPDVELLLFEVRYLTKYIEEEFLFKVGLSIQAGRSEAKKLKKSSKVHEPPAPSSEVHSKRKNDDPPTLLKKQKKLEGISTSTSLILLDSSPDKLHVPGEVMKHQCLGRRKANDLLSRRMELEVELTQTLTEWNDEFVKVKYLQGEYQQKYNQKTKEVKVLEVELTDCRTELANIMTATSLKNQQVDRLQIELVEAQDMIEKLLKDQKVSGEKVAILEAENKKSRTLIAEKEAALFGLESSRVIEDFKKSIAFKTIIQDHVQEAREHIYNVEVKALEQQCMDEGFTRGFLKGVRLVQRKAGVKIDGLTTSQASEDPSSDLDGAEIESELRKAFSSDDESVDVE
ncbi:hypothetical protein M5K25_024060 [Dendrobium thyrsiflorum]|uniref:Uncharacterized protein n=1 Tax=Dendrobium thyrsiflorum TaxID=117978 RepID=A0ABD0U123_DENTH